MRRRRFLGAMSAGLVSGLAGCDATTGGGPETASETATPAEVPDVDGPVREQVGDVDLPVPRGEIETQLPRDFIPAVVDPAFASDWSDLSVPDHSTYDGGPLLPDDAPVVGVEHDGRARAYPLRVLNWHEVVNDNFGGPLLVSYCVLCGSAVTAERRVDGAETTFGVSGKLWRSDLVLYDDATDSLWSQLLATAIRGQRTGERLTLRPSSLTAWGEWRDRHPDTEVLLPPPKSGTRGDRAMRFDYFSEKYGYDGAPLIGYERTSEDLPPRTLVVGVTVDGRSRAYPHGAVVEASGVVEETLAGTPLVVTTTPAGALAAYDRRAGGETLSFAAADERHLLADGSRWLRATGEAVDGPHEGQVLTQVNDLPPMFWLGWSGFNPETTVYGGAE